MNAEMVAQARNKIKEWRINPVKYVWDQFKVKPDKWQERALKIFPSQTPTEQRMSLQACVGPGKTALLSWCIWNFLSCYGEPGEHPKGSAVSITFDNLKQNLWAELSKWQGRSQFLTNAFVWTKERIYSVNHPNTWFFAARAWSKKASAEELGRTLSGIHSKYVLNVIDESGDIPVPIMKGAEQALSNCTWGKIMQAGNPSSLDGMLYAAATTARHQWHITRITGDPDDPDRSERIDTTWAREQIQTYGRDNPWVMYSILGLFPPSSINALLGPDEVEAAMHRSLRESDVEHSQMRLGVDAARFGDDPWVIFPRKGLWALEPTVMRNPRSHEVAARVAHLKRDLKSDMEFFDGTGGFAGGAVDSLIQAGHTPFEVNFSGSANDSRYFNKRSEMWFLMAEWIKRGGCIPKIPTLSRELTAPTYTFQNGKFRLEEKEQIKKRVGHSTNYADALCTTFAMPDMPKNDSIFERVLGNRPGRVKTEFDPYAVEQVA